MASVKKKKNRTLFIPYIIVSAMRVHRPPTINRLQRWEIIRAKRILREFRKSKRRLEMTTIGGGAVGTER